MPLLQDSSLYTSIPMQHVMPYGVVVLSNLFWFRACRYYVDKDWTAKKLEVLVDVPDKLDLEHLRAKGPQPDEQLQPEVCALAMLAGRWSRFIAIRVPSSPRLTECLWVT